MRSETETHIIYFKKEGQGDYNKQPACGKDDLFSCIRQMMKDGYTIFKIETIKN